MTKSRSKYDWPHHIAQQKSSGLSVKEYCLHAGFSSWSFYVNRKKLSSTIFKSTIPSNSEGRSFIPLGSFQPCNGISVIFPDGIRIEFHGQQEEEQLHSIFMALRRSGGVRRC